MPTSKSSPNISVKVSEVAIRPDNPQTMSDEEFGNLVESIKRNGFLQEIVVAEGCASEPDKLYEVLSGSHRLRAAIVAGYDEVPAKNMGKLDEKERVRLLYNLNVRGKIDKKALEKMVVGLMNGGLSQADMQEMLLVPGSELNTILKAIRTNLPKELRKSFDLAKVEVKTIDDISRILNRLFNEYGKTVDLGYMWFAYGGKDQFYVRLNNNIMQLCKELDKVCQETGVNINEYLEKVLEAGMEAVKLEKAKK